MFVYDLDNIAHDKDPIDCRECVAEMGWTLLPREEKQPEEVKDAFTEMSRAELQGNLDHRNIPYPANMKKADLLALCRG